MREAHPNIEINRKKRTEIISHAIAEWFWTAQKKEVNRRSHRNDIKIRDIIYMNQSTRQPNREKLIKSMI